MRFVVRGVTAATLTLAVLALQVSSTLAVKDDDDSVPNDVPGSERLATGRVD